MADGAGARKVIAVQRGIIGPAEPRVRSVRERRLGDYAHLPQAYRDVARKLSSPLLMGPPVCDELMDLVQHLFTEEEAGAVRHLGLARGMSAAQVARSERRPVEQVEPILWRLADQKFLIAASGPVRNRRYRLLPLMPGMFEMALIGQDPQNLSPWHRRAAELFERLYDTGYIVDYPRNGTTPFVRYLPVGKAIAAHPMALPTDKLEIVLDAFKVFGVGHCQCRMSARVVGRGCGKPTLNCLVMGEWAAGGIEKGQLRRVSRQEALAIKQEAESHGMVNWMMNVSTSKGQCSCSCCGCCCKALRTINEFNAPSVFAPPHFVPRHDASRCAACGQCARRCPMGAITVDLRAKTFVWNAARCVGCGQCALACESQALAMSPVPDYRLPYPSWFSLLVRGLPGMLGTAWRVWRSRG